MGLETGNFISDLDVANPVPTDKRRFGDDHFRLLKSVLRNTLPNADGAINPSVEEFNHLVGVTSLIQNQLDAKLAAASLDALIQAYNYAVRTSTNVWTQTQAIPPVDLGTDSGVISVDLRDSTGFILTLDGDATLSFSNTQNGQGLVFKITQGGAGSYTITWPGTVHFENQTPPILTTTVGAYDVIAGKYIDGNFVAGILKNLG